MFFLETVRYNFTNGHCTRYRRDVFFCFVWYLAHCSLISMIECSSESKLLHLIQHWEYQSFLRQFWAKNLFFKADISPRNSSVTISLEKYWFLWHFVVTRCLFMQIALFSICSRWLKRLDRICQMSSKFFYMGCNANTASKISFQ